MSEQQMNLFSNSSNDSVVFCQRCKARCKVSEPLNPKAKMLRRSKDPKGLCVNCAVHDWLINTYPVNMLLAKSGPKSLALPHLQEQFTGIMRTGMADAMPDEIDWNLIIKNWELPFPHKVKPRAMNPCSQKELDEVAAGTRPGIGDFDPMRHRAVCSDDLTITSFEQLNELTPGLGDDLRKCLRDQNES